MTIEEREIKEIQDEQTYKYELWLTELEIEQEIETE